jgi:hypothetical protein
MKYGSLVVFIRNDSAEVWGFRYGLSLAIGILKIMASAGVFVRVVCTLNHSISSFPCSQNILLTYFKHRNSYSHKKFCPERDFYEERHRTKQTERQPRIVVDLMKFNI